MCPLKIRLFGKFSVLYNDRELESFQSGKAKQLFSYLLLHGDRPHAREVLAGLLWGDCTTVQSKKYFRQTLWQLQQALHSLSPSGHIRFLQVDGDYLRLDSEADFWLDVAAFEKAFAPVRGITGGQIGDHQAETLRIAVSLYSGDLLEGWFQDWCIYHRERLQSIYLAMLDKLMEYCEFHHDYENGLSFGERLLRQDNAREQTYFRLMRLHYLAGDRAGALRQFLRCASALERELGVRPAQRTLELYEQIRADQFGAPPLPQAETHEQFRSKPTPPSFFSRLKRVRSLLLKLQNQVEQDIREIDQALSTRATRHSSGRR